MCHRTSALSLVVVSFFLYHSNSTRSTKQISLDVKLYLSAVNRALKTTIDEYTIFRFLESLDEDSCFIVA